MLVVTENVMPYFNKVCAFAERTKQSEKLWQQLWYLHCYCDREIPEVRVYRCGTCQFCWTGVPFGTPLNRLRMCPRCNGLYVNSLFVRPSNRGETSGTGRCHLFYDSAPASFTFSLDNWRGNSWEQMFYGGLIYHGNQAGWEMSDGQVVKENERVETFNVQVGFSSDSNPWTINT